jgi:uncharacterized protein YecE (DUF72 family)
MLLARRYDTMSRSNLFLGTSGWSYEDWVGPFYSPGTGAAQWLPIYAKYFDTVEIDSTFYRPPSDRMIEGWRERTPEGFQFAAKVPRAITHDAQLVNVADELTYFTAQMRKLGPKCGPLLFQFAPSFTADAWDDLAALLPTLPTDLRWVVEVRHRSWLDVSFYDLLRAHNVALAHVDLPWMPRNTPVTADFVYVRWLGDRKAIPEDFSHVREDLQREDDLDWWARQIERLNERGVAVYGYANNHYQGHSPETVRELQRRLGLPVRMPEAAPQQQGLGI